MKENDKSTVDDVAQLANVSTATVSRVFNRSARVNKDTSQKVFRAAKKLNYRPSRVAQRLRGTRKHSMVIGLIVTDLENPFFSEIARGVEEVAFDNQNAVMVCNSNENKDKEKFYLETLIAEQVAGFIIVPTPYNNELITRIVENKFPVVCVDRQSKINNVDTVTVNNTKGAYLAVDHLIKLGHRRIAVINGLKNLSTTKERFAGYKEAFETHGLPLINDLILYGNSREKGGIECTRKLLELEDGPTAIFSTNNLMTLGCLEELNAQGVKITDDIALIGFDDMPWSKALNPPLSAVRQPGHELGVSAAKLLLRRIANPLSNTTDVVLNPELVIRKTCGILNK